MSWSLSKKAEGRSKIMRLKRHNSMQRVGLDWILGGKKVIKGILGIMENLKIEYTVYWVIIFLSLIMVCVVRWEVIFRWRAKVFRDDVACCSPFLTVQQNLQIELMREREEMWQNVNYWRIYTKTVYLFYNFCILQYFTISYRFQNKKLVGKGLKR